MDKHEAIYKLYPNVAYINDEVPYDEDNNEVTYDNNAVEALMASEAYKDQRQKEYPSIQEQLDMQYWDSINGTTTWQDAIETIKNKYPKP